MWSSRFEYKVRRKKVGNEITVTKEKLNKLAESCPAARQALEEAFPEAFSQAYVSGDMFFAKSKYEFENKNNQYSQKGKLAEDLGTGEVNIMAFNFRKYIYVLAHLKNSHEYGLFNLCTGYQLHRGEVYIRKQGVGIMIPQSRIEGLVKIRTGGGC
jgi:hypothetical protein